MPMRFLIDAEPLPDTDIALDHERSHYLCKVLRHKQGDTVPCFNGRGTAFAADLVEAHTKRSVLRVVGVAPVAAPPAPSLTLALGLLKGQAMDRALQQAAELGAAAIYLIPTERSNVSLSTERVVNKLAHWRKIVAGACEQSGHLFVPQVSLLKDLSALLADNETETVVLDMDGAPLPPSLASRDRLLPIGPEGGWSDNERALFQAQNRLVFRLTDSTLRAETAPAVALALFKHLMRDT